MKILVINPGATSTKFAIYAGEKPSLKKVIDHSGRDLQRFKRVFDQYQYRLELIKGTLNEAGVNLQELTAVIARGGLLKPIESGTYSVNKKMLKDLEKAERGEHASNLGAVLAYNIGQELGIPAFIADPVAVDELEPIARISGLADIERVSLFHALNHKAVARKVAQKLGKQYEDMNFIVAHLGSGISIGTHKKGRVVDVNDAKDEGPFSPDRCGGVPAYQLVKLCYSGKYNFQQMKEKIMPQGGMFSYLGTKDLREIENIAKGGDDKARLLLEALAYQIAKDIGAHATVLCGKVDGIVLTGGIAYSQFIVDKIIERVKFIAPVEVVSGEEELESLALAALRVLTGECEAKIYE